MPQHTHEHTHTTQTHTHAHGVGSGPVHHPAGGSADHVVVGGVGAASVHDVYAPVAELAAIVGQPQGQDDRLNLAMLMGSRWVDYTVGYNVASRVAADDPELGIPQTPVEAPISVQVVPVPAGPRAAALVAAARFLRSGDVPFSVAGGFGDLAVRVQASIPEAELQLYGHREDFGVA